jgi:hypothetical protein
MVSDGARRLKMFMLAAVSALALASCGGGSPASSTDTPAAPPSPPGGLYVGYYQEDPTTNPEDPTPGAFYLNLPANDSPFNGNMYFTYVGCQTSNVGTVSGTKAGASLSGSWTGTVDGSAQSGAYSGTYDATRASYAGTYTVSGGKQHIIVAGCIQYYIAPNGTWEMFALEKSIPSDFNVAVSGATAAWAAPAAASTTLVYVLDAAVAQSGNGNPIKWQDVVAGSVASVNLATAGLTSGKEYICVVKINNSASARIAFTSKRFVAP